MIYVRSSLSSQIETKFLPATMIDEIKNQSCFTVSSDQILCINEPTQSKYYVNFTYYTTDTAYVSYFRSNLNWKTHYQLHLFEELKEPILIAMVDIRNNGKSNIDIECAELLADDINLQISEQQNSWTQNNFYYTSTVWCALQSSPTVEQHQEVAGLYVYTINQSFSIDGKQIIFYQCFVHNCERTYRLSSDVFLPRENCMIREYDYLIGDTFLLDIAAKDTHEFSIGQDPDIFL
ncbi:unnamed protein product [Rotaria sordida]|uniref:Uncharacterized protein n=1 Tax=Rotaria sordida TaxID=392033 RepID=A0A815SV02_9BILA|nr:unnamed protein product [Rotaria sordida]CAF1492815.1 unnamed protein product [Rotaria sordida]